MNIEKLTQVRDTILRNPKLVDMDCYFMQTECGTAACIAGWATWLALTKSEREEIDTYGSHESYYFAGKSILGLTDKQADKLFYLSDWPVSFLVDYIKCVNRGNSPAKIVAARIDHFRKTGK
tara:strand:- start:98 stop:463 length:366 start_codon:yes stop_codon:yes gene_type:complete